MKDDETWSEGSLERAAVYSAAIETDCSNWDAEGDLAEWSEGQLVSAAVPVLGVAASQVAPAPSPDHTKIRDDAGLIAARERISQILDLLASERQSVRRDEFAAASQAYRAEVERLQREVLDYLTGPPGTAR
jgi:hypothetical protein